MTKRIPVDRSPQAGICFVPVSTDERTIRFFGTLMPALLFLKASPGRFVQHQFTRHHTPKTELASFIVANTDDAARIDDKLVFVHRWHSPSFDPFAFAQAKTTLARIVRLARREGYSVEALDPLSPSINLPKLAARAGLGNLSPFGLLVHPAFGPRLILSGLRTDLPLNLVPRWHGKGCTDCLSCLETCPQKPLKTATVELRLCQSCAECLVVCPVGKE